MEGANLFVTDAARATLQDRGVALFKDASTNKVRLRLEFVAFTCRL